MKNSGDRSPSIIRRLPKYYRAICELSEITISRVSSKELGKLTGFNPSQIRQDLNSFGGFGQQGYGYNVKNLKENLEEILNLTTKKTMILLGVGNLGNALLNYPGFNENGFEIIAAFDRDRNKIGTEIGGVKIHDIDTLQEFLKNNTIDIAVITLHKDVAQRYATICAESGIRGFWNFAPKKLRLPSRAVVENIWLNESLYTLGYFLTEKIREEDELLNNTDYDFIEK